MALTAKKVYAILKRQISDMEAKLNSPVRYRGTVATADLLPLNPDIGDMYNIESKSIYGEAGMNVAWNGVVWDTMGAPIDMSLYFAKEEAEAVIQRLVTEYFEKNPVKPGATTEQAQQIEQNKTDIASLKTETSSLKEDVSNKITKFYASNQGETHITDSDNGKIQDMMIYGKSSQNGTPTPENPVEIKNVVNPTVKVCGKNLLNYNAWKGTPITRGTAIYENNGITLTATENDCYSEMGNNFPDNAKIKVSEGETLTLSWEQIENNKEGYIYIFGNGIASNSVNIDNRKSKKLSYTVPSGVTFITFRFGVAATGDTISYKNIQIEKGSEATSYEPYHDEQTVTLPYTLNAIPVSSGGNVTIDGQQYIVDYVDVERGKLVRIVDSSKLDNTQSIVNKIEWLLAEPQKTDLTKEEITAFKALATYYPTTNISVNSEQLDGYTVFNYPIHFEEEWNKTQKEIGGLKEDLSNIIQDQYEILINKRMNVILGEFEKGSINADGSNQDVGAGNLLRTKKYIKLYPVPYTFKTINGNGLAIYIYDSNGIFLRAEFMAATMGERSRTITFLETDYKCRIVINSYNNDYENYPVKAENIESIIIDISATEKKSKTICCIGDSFTASTNSWHTYIRNRMGYNMINLGVAGTRISVSYTSGGKEYTSFIERVENGVLDAYTPDLIMVFGGINDTVKLHNAQMTIGTINDSAEYSPTKTSGYSFIGRVKYLIELIKSKKPGVPILGVIPPNYSEGISDYEWWSEYISQIQDALRSVYEYYGILYVDLKKTCQEMYEDSYNLATYRIDGRNNMHPSVKGHKAIGKRIEVDGINKMFDD